MRPLLYGDPVKPYEIIVGLCICGRHRKSNAAISRARRKFNQTLAPYRHNAAVESDLAPRFGGCAAGFGLGREFTLSAMKSHWRFFSKPAAGQVQLPVSGRWLGAVQFFALRDGCAAIAATGPSGVYFRSRP
jgi:hypothetical protein